MSTQASPHDRGAPAVVGVEDGRAPRRDVRIDALRGLAVGLVVLGHAILRAGLDGTLLFNLVVLVNMPLFMLLSGRVTDLGGPQPRRRLARRAWGLMVPYFSWLPVYFAFTPALRHQFEPILWAVSALYLPKAPGHLWFLYVLFVCVALGMAVVQVTDGPRSWLVGTFAVAFGLSLVPSGPDQWFGIAQVGWLMPFFAVGVIGSISIGVRSRRDAFAVAGATVALVLAVWLLGPAAVKTARGPLALLLEGVGGTAFVGIATTASRYAAAFAGILVLCALLGLIPLRHLGPAASLGRRSLGVYAVHPFLLWLPEGAGWMTVSAFALLAVAASWAIVVLIEQAPQVSRLLLGRPLPESLVD